MKLTGGFFIKIFPPFLLVFTWKHNIYSRLINLILESSSLNASTSIYGKLINAVTGSRRNILQEIFFHDDATRCSCKKISSNLKYRIYSKECLGPKNDNMFIWVTLTSLPFGNFYCKANNPWNGIYE